MALQQERGTFPRWEFHFALLHFFCISWSRSTKQLKEIIIRVHHPTMKRNEFRLGTPRNFLLTRGLVGVERRTHYASKTFLINFNRMQFSEKIYETYTCSFTSLAPNRIPIRRNYSPRSANRVCLALSSLRALGELRCQETTRHRSVSSCPNNVSLLFPA